MRAMVIDDSRAMRSILKASLKGLRFEVVEAGNGREGLDRLDGPDRPDLILVDWNMPEMGGLDFVKAVRTRRDLDPVRLVMVTTETDMVRMAEAMAEGADEYVMKPFTPDVIAQKLEQIGLLAP